MRATAIIGIGNEYRGDDGVGRFVVRQLAERMVEGVRLYESNGEALSLMELWKGTSTVILVDAAEATIAAGSVHRLDASQGALPIPFFHASTYASTHAFSLAEAIEMARSLDRLPETVIVYAIEGAGFGHGKGLTPEVERGAREAAERILEEVSLFSHQ